MRQTAKHPIFYMFSDEPKMQILFSSVPKGNYAQFVETNVLVKHNIYHELKLTTMDLDLQITWKHTIEYQGATQGSPFPLANIKKKQFYSFEATEWWVKKVIFGGDESNAG